MIRRYASGRDLFVCLLLLAVGCAMWSCSRNETCGCGPGTEPEEVLYSSSFESAADTVGWTRYGGVWLADDAAPGGGGQAIGVAGGCIWPHAAYTLEPLAAGGSYTVRCWAKLAEQPGVVELRVAGEYTNEIRLSVESPRWVQLYTTGSIWCPRGRSLEVQISSGGFAQPGGILVDLLEVVRADR